MGLDLDFLLLNLIFLDLQRKSQIFVLLFEPVYGPLELQILPVVLLVLSLKRLGGLLLLLEPELGLAVPATDLAVGRVFHELNGFFELVALLLQRVVVLFQDLYLHLEFLPLQRDLGLMGLLFVGQLFLESGLDGLQLVL